MKREEYLGSPGDPSGPNDTGEVEQQQGGHDGHSQQSGDYLSSDSTQPGGTVHSDDPGRTDNVQQLAGTQSSAPSDNVSGSKYSSGPVQQGSSNGGFEQSGYDNSDGTTQPDDIIHSEDAGNSGPTLNGNETTVVWKHDGEAFTAVSNDGVVVVNGNGATSTLAAGATSSLASQVIEAFSAANAVVINGAIASFESVAGNKKSLCCSKPRQVPPRWHTEWKVLSLDSQCQCFRLQEPTSSMSMASLSRCRVAGTVKAMEKQQHPTPNWMPSLPKVTRPSQRYYKELRM